MTRTIKIIISIIATVVDFIIIMPLAALVINNGNNDLGLQIFLIGPIVTGVIALLLSGGLLTSIRYIFDFDNGEYPLLALFIAIALKTMFVVLFPVVALDTARDNKESNFENGEYFEEMSKEPEEKKRKIELKNDGSFEDMLRMAGVDVDE